MIKRSLKVMTTPNSSLLKFSAAAAFFSALSFSGSAQALIVNLGTISTPETIGPSSLAYTSNEVIDFKFTVDAPLHFDFTATGSGGTFPFPIAVGASGTSGTYTEVFGPFPVHGTVSYTLTAAVPEVSTWAMMLLGFAGLGFAGYSRGRATNAGVAAV